MSENKNFKEHLNAFNEITDQLMSVKIEFDDEVQALLILGQLPESWKGTVQSISGAFGKEKLKFSEVVDMIMTEEIRRREDGFFNSNSTLNMESRRRSNTRGGQCGRSKSRRGRSKSRSRQNNSHGGKKDIECWNCHKMGHYRSECKAPKKESDG